MFPGLLEWGTVMGSDEAACYASYSAVLEEAVEGGRLRLGGRGWREQAVGIVSEFLNRGHHDLPGSSWA